jgi:hypothetical protein
MDLSSVPSGVERLFYEVWRSGLGSTQSVPSGSEADHSPPC